jgi:hypothetical protein
MLPGPLDHILRGAPEHGAMLFFGFGPPSPHPQISCVCVP